MHLWLEQWSDRGKKGGTQSQIVPNKHQLVKVDSCLCAQDPQGPNYATGLCDDWFEVILVEQNQCSLC